MEDKNNTEFKHAIEVLRSGTYKYDHAEYQRKEENEQKSIPWFSKVGTRAIKLKNKSTI